MRILSIESSAKAASTAIVDDGKLTALYYVNCALTHSATLLPMAEAMLNACAMNIGDIDLIAVARGPGSFTGLRIGTATAKGLMWGADKPGCGISTLEAMAWQSAFMEGRLLCCAMDARRSQVYNALFRAENGKPRRLCEDRALSVAELMEDIRETPLLLGDGAELCAAEMQKRGLPYELAPENIRLQNAFGVAMAAAALPPELWGDTDPVYLRLSQAERERNERERKERLE